MTDTKQPEALRLIAEWRNSMPIGVMRIWAADVRDELRRQHAEIESLRAERDNYKALCEEAKPFASRCVELRAKLDELARQEHAAFVNEQGFIIERDDMQISSGEKLYLAAGARPVEPAPQQDAQEPFGYVNTNTGQFFAYVESCRKNNEGHWRTVYTIPQPAPAAQVDVKDAAQLYPVVIDGLLWLCAKHGGTFKPVADCAAVNPPLSWKNALAADKKEPTNGND